MKLLFSESAVDYGNYIFPYAVWAFPEVGETPADLFNAGFLPSSGELDRFYLCRQVRVALTKYRPSSENRRILRKGSSLTVALVARSEFDYSAQRRLFYKTYADSKFGKDVMTYKRLDSLFAGKITSHVLVFADTLSGAEVGAATCYLEGQDMAYYYYAFYDLHWQSRNLGMFMMTSAVGWFAEHGYRFVYLGSCYRPSALYKTQFLGTEFFNGVRWTHNLEELKYLVQRGLHPQRQHLLEVEEYRQAFYACDLAEIVSCSAATIRLDRPGK